MQRKRIGLNAGYSSLCAPASCYSLTRGGRSTSTGKRPIASMSSRGDAGLTRRVAAVSAPETGASVQPGWSSVIEVARDPGINPGINRGNAGGSAGHAPYENCAAHAPRFPGSLGSSSNVHCAHSDPIGIGRPRRLAIFGVQVGANDVGRSLSDQYGRCLKDC